MSPPGGFTLPGRALEEEDAWVRALQGASDAEVIEATRAAVRAGRPGLAGRAVSLVLSDAAVAGDPELERAARAARLLLSRPVPPTIEEWDELLVDLGRRQHMARFKARHRAITRGENPDKPRTRPK